MGRPYHARPRSAGPGAREAWCVVDRAATFGQRWSDHAPVVVGTTSSEVRLV